VDNVFFLRTRIYVPDATGHLSLTRLRDTTDDEPGSRTVGTLTQITPRGRQQVLGGVKRRGRSRRSPQDTKLRKGARIGPRCVGLALIRPRAGATVSGGATLGRKRLATRPILHRCAHLATPYLRPHWTSEGFPEFAKSADACSTLENVKGELH